MSAAPGAGSVPPRSIVEIMLYRKGTVLFWLVVALALGAVYQTFAPPSYTSRAEVAVLRANPDAPGSPLASAGLSTGAPTTHAAMLHSTPVLTQALQDPAVADHPTLRDEEDPLRYLRKELKVAASDETETVTLSFADADPEFAAAMVSAVLVAYFEHQGLPIRGMVRADDDRPTVSIMDEQVIAARLLQMSDQVTQARVLADLTRARRDRALKAGGDISHLQQLLREAGADTETIGLQTLTFLNAEVNRLDQQIQSMPESWGPEHRLRAPIQRQYEATVERYFLAQQGVVAQAVTILEDDYTQASQHHDRLEQELAQLQGNADLARTWPVRVIDPPRVAQRKSSPMAVQTFGIAGFLGLALGGLFAVRAELKDPPTEAAQARPDPSGWSVASSAPLLLNSRADLDQVEAARDVPMLGSVPQLAKSRQLTSPEFTSTASSIHQIRAVLQIQAGKQGTHSYAFTSPRRGAGKTSVTVGIASSLAISGTRTLVVDCDLAGRIVRGQTGRPADPSHIAPFGPIDRQGSSPDNESLDDIAVGQGYIPPSNGEQAVSTQGTGSVGIVGMLEGRPLADCAVKATVEGLWLLPAAGAQTRHIGMMSDQFIRDLLKEARDHYDLVLFDTGPVPGSVEALLVTSQADGVVVVVPHGESGQALERMMSYLKVVDANIIGTVFNQSRKNGAASTNAAGQAHPAQGHPSDAATRNGTHAPRDGDADASDTIGREIDEALDDVPLGSGILAAAVFADDESGFANAGWELRGTSEFSGGPDNAAPSNGNGRRSDARPLRDEVSDILPPE